MNDKKVIGGIRVSSVQSDMDRQIAQARADILEMKRQTETTRAYFIKE